MSKYIKEHSLSVGYNNTGQEFFDNLLIYKKYIHSYFFSLTETQRQALPLNINDILNILSSINTYDIPGNLLLNTFNSDDKWYELINLSLDKNININSVTVLQPETGYKIKSNFPNLEINLSIRYWETIVVDIFKDFNSIKNNVSSLLNKMKDFIDVIIPSASFFLYDHEFSETCRINNFKIKWIANQGCITNKEFNYNTLKKFENLKCISKCNNLSCYKVINEYPWMELARDGILKESLKYIDYDIIKISSRDISNLNIKYMLDYWTSNDTTNFYAGNIIDSLTYPIFLEYLKQRSICINKCGICMKCKDFYDKMMNKGS